MSRIVKVFILLFILLITTKSVYAQWYPDPMDPARLLNDFAGILTLDESDALEVRLMSYRDELKVQVVVIILRDFGRQDPYTYASGIISRWGIGYNSNEKGILILVKPKNQFGPLKVAVAANSYFGDSFNEAVSASIAGNEMAPLLSKGRIYKGVNAGLDAISHQLEGNYELKPVSKGIAINRVLLALAVIAAIAAIITVIVRGGRKK